MKTLLWHIPAFVFKTLICFIATAFMSLVGLPMVAVALLAGTRNFPETVTRFVESSGFWELRRLKPFFLFWDNPFDGALGDSYGDWNRIRNGEARSFFSMWLWLAVRNPANYFGRFVLGIDAKDYRYKLLGGVQEVSETKHGWQFILATHRTTGKHVYSLKFSYPWWFNPKRVFYGAFGYKLQMGFGNLTAESNIRDRLVGVVARVNPYKNIESKLNT